MKAFLVLLVATACAPATPTAVHQGDDRWARCGPSVAHALGAVDSFLYTNSREAFELSYRRGFRVFETDVQWTRDSQLVLAHDWYTPDRQRVPAGGPTLEEFRASAIYGRLTPLAFRDLLELLQAHPDARVVLDLKEGARMVPGVLRDVRAVDTALLERLVPQLYSAGELAAARSAYPWRSAIYALHVTEEDDAAVLATLRREGVGVVTTSRFRFNPGFARRLKDAGVVVYYSLVNTAPESRLYRAWGATGVYTDLLAPESMCPAVSPGKTN